ncbi:uncharacterized protein LOC105695953 [Orussus abietinus]|uniref:uncharacterized protein LOC105695953 n=1 Tax=Orussus abietinus TaxID=222816 RepID=UPI000626BAE8|nr:uncharacterized protein LOC105695953 [Orussus abietinus]XP_012273454.1 uncharacterized protein LOC105695953 [Orussus abietinus]
MAESLISVLEEKNRLKTEQLRKSEAVRKAEYDEILKRLTSVQEQSIQIAEKIGRNLNDITACKHTIHKSINDTSVSKLPITCKYQDESVKFFHDAVPFINDFTNTLQSSDPEKKDVGYKAYDNVINHVDALNIELIKTGTRCLQLETLKKTIEGLKINSDVNFDADMQEIDQSLIFDN